METIDYNQVIAQREQVVEMAGKYLPMLDNMTVAQWIEEIGKQDFETAAKLRRHMAVAEARADPRHGERRANIERVMSEVDAPLHTDVERGIPPNPKDFDLFKSRKGYPSIAKAQKIVTSWLSGEVCPMVTLFGVPGTGKTHLAAAAAARLSAGGELCIYRTEAALIGEAMERMQRRSTERLIEAFCTAPWAILDDMGVAALSDWGRGIMDRWVDSRYELAQHRGGFTLITTNVGGRDLPPRLLRRLSEPGVSQVVQLKAPSYFGEASVG